MYTRNGFFVSFSAARRSASFSLPRTLCDLGPCCMRARTSAFTDTYFISKRDFSVCDRPPPPALPAVHLGTRCAQKYIDFKLATTTRYILLYTHTDAESVLV